MHKTNLSTLQKGKELVIVNDNIPTKEEICCHSLRAMYMQEIDSGRPLDLEDSYNILEIETCSNGIASYFVLKTERWAVDPTELDELIAILEDFKNRFWNKKELSNG